MNKEDYVCVFGVDETSQDLIFRFLKSKYGKPEEDPEIGRSCYIFKRNRIPTARLCLVKRPKVDVRNALTIYDTHTLKLLCDAFSVNLFTPS
jgi:hypothetical protein